MAAACSSSCKDKCGNVADVTPAPCSSVQVAADGLAAADGACQKRCSGNAKCGAAAAGASPSCSSSSTSSSCSSSSSSSSCSSSALAAVAVSIDVASAEPGADKGCCSSKKPCATSTAASCSSSSPCATSATASCSVDKLGVDKGCCSSKQPCATSVIVKTAADVPAAPAAADGACQKQCSGKAKCGAAATGASPPCASSSSSSSSCSSPCSSSSAAASPAVTVCIDVATAEYGVDKGCCSSKKPCATSTTASCSSAVKPQSICCSTKPAPCSSTTSSTCCPSQTDSAASPTSSCASSCASSPCSTTSAALTSTSTTDKRGTWRHAALAISAATIVWNIVEGTLGLVYGAEAESVALLGFGADSWVEVLSAIAVTYRFWQLDTNQRRNTVKEKRATLVIGVLLCILALCIVGGSISALAIHDPPDSSIPSIAISATAIGVMAVLYLTKIHIAFQLSSSTMESDANCTLCCMQLSSVLFIGSLVTHFAGNVVWWFDGATAIVIALLVGREGVNSVRSALRADFDGCGCGSENSGWYMQRLRKNRGECKL